MCSPNERRANLECYRTLALPPGQGDPSLYIQGLRDDPPAYPGNEYGGIEYGGLPVVALEGLA